LPEKERGNDTPVDRPGGRGNVVEVDNRTWIKGSKKGESIEVRTRNGADHKVADV